MLMLIDAYPVKLFCLNFATNQPVGFELSEREPNSLPDHNALY